MAQPVVLSTASSSGIEARKALRETHGVRLVQPAEEGFAISELPDGVFGFTYSPAIAAPLFSTHRYRTFEMHRLQGGEPVIIGFLSAEEARAVEVATGPTEVTLYHDVSEHAGTIVVVPCSRIGFHRQVATPNQPSIPLRINPAE